MCVKLGNYQESLHDVRSTKRYKSLDNAVVDTALLSELRINNAKKSEASVGSCGYKQNKWKLL